MALTGPIVIFDTDCVLCSGGVAFVLRHERDKALRFAGAWSDEGRTLAARHGFSAADLDDTFLLVDDDRALSRSDAALAIARHLAIPWRWLTMLRLLPRPFRDAAYDFMARRRYRWFGRRADCAFVPDGEQDRFVGVTSRRGTSTGGLRQTSRP